MKLGFFGIYDFSGIQKYVTIGLSRNGAYGALTFIAVQSKLNIRGMLTRDMISLPIVEVTRVKV